LWRHFTYQPALSWLAWVLGAVGLLLGSSPVSIRKVVALVDIDTNQRTKGAVRKEQLLLTVAAAVLLFFAAYLRLSLLVPVERGLLEDPSYDEGVYAEASQLFLQGILPYRDYFFAHPPIAAVVYAPAMAVDFRLWGSEASFMAARFMGVAYGLLALVGLLLVGYEAGGKGVRGVLAGATAAALYAVDPRTVAINRKIMLDHPMLAVALFALFFYLRSVHISKAGTDRQRGGLTFPTSKVALAMLVGFLSAASTLIKVQGLTCFLAIFITTLIFMLFLDGAKGRRTYLFGIAGGFLLGLVLLGGPFFLAAPNQFARMVIFFQLLRPMDGARFTSDRIANITQDLSNGLTPSLAIVGAVLLMTTLWHQSRPSKNPAAQKREQAAGALQQTTLSWVAIMLWGALNMLLFTYSRSFFDQYYLEVAAPLYLLTGAIWIYVPRQLSVSRRKFAIGSTAAALALILLPFTVAAIQASTEHRVNTLYVQLGARIEASTTPADELLTTDAQLNLLASRKPSQTITGYLVDSYGYFIYKGLGLQDWSWVEMRGAMWQASEPSVSEVMHRSWAQQDFIDRAQDADFVAIYRGPGPEPATADTIRQIVSLGTRCVFPTIQEQSRYVLVKPCTR
ncbi:MAG TPA: hypothetical protein VF914_16910, partial [Chloroflexia bacterium]